MSLSCRKILVEQAEAYYYDNDLQGHTAEDWELLIDEFEHLLGENGRGSTKESLKRHLELTSEFFAWHAALDACIMLARRNCYAPKICANLRGRFSTLKFSKESLLDDIKVARAKLNTTKRKIDEIEADLPKGSDEKNTTFFDSVILAYNQTFEYAEQKAGMSLQYFAMLYKSLKERIAHDQQQQAKRNG